MKAWILSKPYDLKQVDIPVPQPGPHEILLKILCCGICHTDLHEYKGEFPLPMLPVVPGHPFVGEVVGAGAERFTAGDRVGVPWLHHACGMCEFCAKGAENFCNWARFTELHVHGGFAEFHVVDQEYAHRFSDVLRRLAEGSVRGSAILSGPE